MGADAGAGGKGSNMLAKRNAGWVWRAVAVAGPLKGNPANLQYHKRATVVGTVVSRGPTVTEVLAPPPESSS